MVFHEADLHRLPLPDNAVDTVVCGLTLTHVPDRAPMLAEFTRVLRPGGNLVIMDSSHQAAASGVDPGADVARPLTLAQDAGQFGGAAAQALAGCVADLGVGQVRAIRA